MKIFVRIIKSICLGMFGIYSANVLFNIINVVIPINVFTIGISSILGVFGVMAIVVIELLI